MMRLIFILFLLVSSTAMAKGKFSVMVDPGHGGEDTGTSHNGVMEKKVTLGVGLALYNLLKQDPIFEPHLTRKSDSSIGLDDRMRMAESLKVDAFISIHANSSPTPVAKGSEVYFQSQIPTDEESLLVANRENSIKNSSVEKVDRTQTDVKSILLDLKRSNHMVTSEILSQIVLDTMQSELKIKTKALRQGPFRVLTVSMPSVLVEMGYLSNYKEAHWLNNPDIQKKIAEAMYKGLVEFKKKLDKQKQ